MRILIAAGGTGGHLFPAIRMAEEIRLQCLVEILFAISCRKQDRDILKKKGLIFKTLPVIPLQSRKVLHILNFALRLTGGTIKSMYLLLRFRPSRVVGFGGYISGPILLLAALCGIKTIIHEQNVYPGKTNRILCNFVNKIAVSFPETEQYLKKFSSKIVVSGNPLRRELKKKNKTGDTFTVLAMGGSQGSRALNKIVPDAIDLIQGNRKDNLDMIHISGYSEREDVKKNYQQKGIKSRVFSFTEGIGDLYAECDFVIARAGATTVSELLYLAKPSILIPYPYANSHQLFNARVLEKAGLAVLLEENGLTPEDLRNVMIRLMDRDVLSSMSRRAKLSNDKNPCDILIKEIISGE